MKKEDLKNGFIIINGDKAKPLPDDLFDVPTKEREEEIIKLISEDLKNEIGKIIEVKIVENDFGEITTKFETIEEQIEEIKRIFEFEQDKTLMDRVVKQIKKQ